MHWQGKAYSKDSSPFTAGIAGQLIWSWWVNAALQNISKYQESKALLLQNQSFSTYTQMATGTRLTKIKQETTITVRKNVLIYYRKSQTWKDRREKNTY